MSFDPLQCMDFTEKTGPSRARNTFKQNVEGLIYHVTVCTWKNNKQGNNSSRTVLDRYMLTFLALNQNIVIF